MAAGVVCVAIGVYGLFGLDEILFGVYSAAARDTNLLAMLILFGGALFFYAAFELGINVGDSD